MSEINGRRSRALRGQAILAAAVMAWGATAYGQTTQPVVWDGGSAVDDKYVTPENWNPDVTPTNAANQFLQINDGSTALVQAGDAAEGAFLMLGMRPGDAGHLNISGGTLTLGEMRVGGRETVNSNLADWTLGTFDPNGGGTGSVTQTGGEVFVNYTTGTEPPIQSLYIGDAGLSENNTANGTYNISGGTLTVGIAEDDAIVIGTGVGTVGTFIQSGNSAVTSTGFISVGRRGAVATYTMSGGTLLANGGAGLSIGDGEAGGIQSTSGTFTQNDGTVTTARDVRLGRRSADGVYNMSGGTLNIGTTVGTPSGGSLIIGGESQGTVELMQGSGVFNLSGNAQVNIGRTTDTSGAFGNLNIGFTNGGLSGGTNTGLLDMDGGTVTLNRPGAIMAVGNGRGAVGTVDQSAGTLNLSGATANMSVGRNNASGTYNLSGTGVLNATTITMESGVLAGTTPLRQINVSGGTLAAGHVNFGSGATAAVRSLNVSGGNVTLGRLTLGNSAATTSVTGGTFNITDRFVLSSNGIFRTAVPLTLAPTFELGNATVQVDASELQLTGPFVQTVGRTLSKTGAGTLTITGDMSGLTGNSAFTNAAGGGVLNYNTVGSPTIALNANSGTLNVGAAQNIRAVGVNGGTLDVAANNVTTSEAVALADGTITGTTGIVAGASFDVRKGTADAVLGGVGVLTKSTADTVTLSRANTYTGGTNVQAGTLQVRRMHENNAVNIVAGKLQVLDSSPTLPSHPSGDNAFVSRPSSLAIANDAAPVGTRVYAGQLDLGNNDLVIDYDGASPRADIEDMVRAGYNGGDWLGNGIGSSTANANRNFALAVADNALLTIPYSTARPFSGQEVDATTILVKFTHRIDLDLDGVITTNDATIFNSSYNEGAAAYWSIGDLDYDRVFTSNDATLFNSFYSEALASVPEPAALGVLAVGALGLLGRRRRGA